MCELTEGTFHYNNKNNNNAIALFNTDTVTWCWTWCMTREHDGSVEFLEKVSRRTRITIKHIKISYIRTLLNHSSPHTLSYNNNMLTAPRMTQKCPTLSETQEHHMQHPRHMAARSILTLCPEWEIGKAGRCRERTSILTREI